MPPKQLCERIYADLSVKKQICDLYFFIPTFQHLNKKKYNFPTGNLLVISVLWTCGAELFTGAGAGEKAPAKLRQFLKF